MPNERKGLKMDPLGRPQVTLSEASLGETRQTRPLCFDNAPNSYAGIDKLDIYMNPRVL